MDERRNIDARIAYDDLREWLAKAELLGEVRDVKGANWQEDIGLAAEADQFQRRAAIGFIGIAVLIGGLCFGYFRLQVLQHQEYITRSEANRIKPKPIVPGRGLILDRKGRVLADNVPEFRLDVMPEEAGDLDVLLKNLSAVVTLTPEEITAYMKSQIALWAPTARRIVEQK